MNPGERIQVALSGGKPDRVPILPIYDKGYVFASIGRDPREFLTAPAAERLAVIEQNFLRHAVDGLFVYEGTNDDWARRHEVDKAAASEYWLVTDKATGKQRRLLPNSAWLDADGRPLVKAEAAESRIRSSADIPRYTVRPYTEAELERIGFFAPLALLSAKYPEHYFCFPVHSPMVYAVGACGGYAAALLLLAENPVLFREIMEYSLEYALALLQPARKAGARAAWFISYHTGADTISPRTYAEVVFPVESRFCRRAAEEGLAVINWFLGDLQPILATVLRLPINALALEQGRKGYSLDPVEIRKRVGNKICLIGYTPENTLTAFDRAGIIGETRRQIEGAGAEGAFIAGTTIVPADVRPEALDCCFNEVRRYGYAGPHGWNLGGGMKACGT